jgi:hypothetical protein
MRFQKSAANIGYCFFTENAPHFYRSGVIADNEIINIIFSIKLHLYRMLTSKNEMCKQRLQIKNNIGVISCQPTNNSRKNRKFFVSCIWVEWQKDFPNIGNRLDPWRQLIDYCFLKNRADLKIHVNVENYKNTVGAESTFLYFTGNDFFGRS